MHKPVSVTVPHKLGIAEARNRMDSGIHKLGESVPGATVSGKRWEGDALLFTISMLGQQVSSRLEVRESEVFGTFDLPPLLAMFADKIRSGIEKGAPKMLE